MFTHFDVTTIGPSRYAVLYLDKPYWPKNVHILKRFCLDTGLHAMQIVYKHQLKDYGRTHVVRVKKRHGKCRKGRAYLGDRVMMRWDGDNPVDVPL